MPSPANMLNGKGSWAPVQGMSRKRQRMMLRDHLVAGAVAVVVAAVVVAVNSSMVG